MLLIIFKLSLKKVSICLFDGAPAMLKTFMESAFEHRTVSRLDLSLAMLLVIGPLSSVSVHGGRVKLFALSLSLITVEFACVGAPSDFVGQHSITMLHSSLKLTFVFVIFAHEKSAFSIGPLFVPTAIVSGASVCLLVLAMHELVIDPLAIKADSLGTIQCALPVLLTFCISVSHEIGLGWLCIYQRVLLFLAMRNALSAGPELANVTLTNRR